MSPPPRMTLADWGLLLFLSLLWGGSFFFNQVAVAEIPPLTLVACRVALAAVTLWAVAGLLGFAVPRGRAALAAFAGMGLLNNAVPFTLIVWGQAQIGSGVAAILNASTPVFAVLLAHGLTADERQTSERLAGVVAGFAGVAVMMGGAALGGGPLAAYAAYAACLGGAAPMRPRVCSGGWTAAWARRRLRRRRDS